MAVATRPVRVPQRGSRHGITMAFPALDGLREGDEVYPVVDAIGGTYVEAHWRLNGE
jgi:hypothetical protein